MLCCAQPCQCVLSQPVVNPHRVAPNRFDQHSSSVNSADFLKLLRTCQFFVCVFCETERSLRSCAHFADLIIQKCSVAVSFLAVLKCKSSSRHSPLHFLSTTFPDRGPHLRKQTPYFRSHVTRKKHTVSRLRVLSPVNSHTPPNCYTSQILEDGWLTWWCRWHDGVNANHDHRS